MTPTCSAGLRTADRETERTQSLLTSGICSLDRSPAGPLGFHPVLTPACFHGWALQPSPLPPFISALPMWKDSWDDGRPQKARYRLYRGLPFLAGPYCSFSAWAWSALGPWAGPFLSLGSASFEGLLKGYFYIKIKSLGKRKVKKHNTSPAYLYWTWCWNTYVLASMKFTSLSH